MSQGPAYAGRLEDGAVPLGQPEAQRRVQEAPRPQAGRLGASRHALRGLLKRQLTRNYLLGSQMLARYLVSSQAERSFRRVCVVAALQRANGITEGARLQFEALRQIGVEAELIDASPALRNPLARIAHQPGSAYVFHSGGPQTANLILGCLRGAAKAWRIGYWAWELPDPPDDWQDPRGLIHEIWTPSGFARDSLRRRFTLPIHVVPHHLPVPAMPETSGGTPGPDRPFTVLAMADSRSSYERKNPIAAVKAFRAAFADSNRANLVVKLNGRAEEMEALCREIGKAPNIEVVQAYLDQDRLQALYRSADAFLSLHRAEGFGLPMAEAMMQGLPVVATGWSGNLEFMDASNSILVPYELVPVADGAGVYGAGSHWAEPRIEAAAQALRRLADDPAYRAAMAAAARRSSLARRFGLP